MRKQKKLSLRLVNIASAFTFSMPAFAAGLRKTNESAEWVIDTFNDISTVVGTTPFLKGLKQ